MLLKSITPRNFGPFVGETPLYIERDVTVITGPNDVGKSLALRAIEILCTEKTIDEHEVNSDRVRAFNGKWTDDSEIICGGIFETTDADSGRKGHPPNAGPGSTLNVHRRMNLSEGQVTKIEYRGSVVNTRATFTCRPRILKLPLTSEVSQEINLGTMTEAEIQLIRLGFGAGFSFEEHQRLSPVDRAFRIRHAETLLNAKLRRILPQTMPLSFAMMEVAAQPEVLGIALVDEQSGFVPLGSRGAGVRRLLNVMGSLLRVEPDDGHTIILYDEPETSLHADAQHMLRRLLERLASNPGIQVVYTTHSPAMVNTLRPRALRIVQRKEMNGKAVSVFINNPSGSNFVLVRSSLGISPADSLLYAPITIIAEGATEVQCIPLVLQKLATDGVIPSDQLEVLLSQSHFLDGEGSSFEHMCRLAKSQNTKPVVFIDGDKPKDIEKVREMHPEIPVVSLPCGTEFEQVVPRAKYIEAVADVLKDNSGNLNEAEFVKYEAQSNWRPSLMFSKRIERWLSDAFDMPLYKPKVMHRAIELTATSHMEIAAFKQLFEAMQQAGGAP